MNKYPLSAFIKLGASIRYLYEVTYEVRTGKPVYFGDQHVIPNIGIVIQLINDLNLTEAGKSQPFMHLIALKGRFIEASKKKSVINQEEADELHETIKKFRQRVYADAEKKQAYCLNTNEIAPKPSPWPETINIDVILQTPWKVWAVAAGLLISGIYIGSTGLATYIEEEWEKAINHNNESAEETSLEQDPVANSLQNSSSGKNNSN